MLGCICFCARIRPLAVLLLVVTLAVLLLVVTLAVLLIAVTLAVLLIAATVLLIAVGAAGNFTPHLALATEAQTDEMENELG